ncbi:MAG: hypothetical protein LW688_13050, partial [Cryomorphaceae bacterium]|nr:hypothetical protein [Cryomorphaceae bacterium]
MSINKLDKDSLKKLITSSTLIFLFFKISAQSYTSYFTGNTLDVVTNSKGGICLMGGASEDDEALKWFLDSANGGDV